MPESHTRLSIARRLIASSIFVVMATVVALAAWAFYDSASRRDTVDAYHHLRSPLLLVCMGAIAIAGSLVAYGFQLKRGRIVSGFIIGVVLAMLITPSTSESPRSHGERVFKDRYTGFRETAVEYIAFCIPVAISVLVASPCPRNEEP